MQISFSKNEIIRSSLSPYDNYCVGYAGKGGYFTALVMGIGRFKKTFSRSGSKILDTIIAYDRAEIADSYLGQINMQIVSSFCGPQGIIWGYDVVSEEEINTPLQLQEARHQKLEGVEIKSGGFLRRASKALLGTNDARHFPFLPGTHVPCAGRFQTMEGPGHLYAGIGIGIPENRAKNACLLMEDVGILGQTSRSIEEKILLDLAQSILEVGKNQKIIYKEIFVDFVNKEIQSNEIGCALVAMPYFHLAKKASHENLTQQTLKEWTKNSERYFISNQ